MMLNTNNLSVAGLMLVLSTALGCAVGMEDEGSTKTDLLSAREKTEVQRAYFDAACYCESYLLDVSDELGLAALVQPSDGACHADEDLTAYAQRFSVERFGTWERTNRCGADDLSDASPHGALPESLDLPSANGCVNRQSIGIAGYEGTTGGVTGGFCRADFNYCLAQQLRLKADSFARAP